MSEFVEPPLYAPHFKASKEMLDRLKVEPGE